MPAALMLALVLTTQVPAPPSTQPPPRKTDEARLQGTWETTIPGPRPELTVTLTMDVMRDSFTWRLHLDDEAQDRVIKGKLQVDSGKRPRQITLVELNADGRLLPNLPAIYMFESKGRVLKILGPAGPDEPRPVRFADKDGAVPDRLLVFTKKLPPQADPEPEPEDDDEVDEPATPLVLPPVDKPPAEKPAAGTPPATPSRPGAEVATPPAARPPAPRPGAGSSPAPRPGGRGSAPLCPWIDPTRTPPPRESRPRPVRPGNARCWPWPPPRSAWPRWHRPRPRPRS